jgi:transcriptional regulator with GAF, ATPase, and Fis domain
VESAERARKLCAQFASRRKKNMMNEESLLSNLNSMKRDAAICNKRAGFGAVPFTKYHKAQKHNFDQNKPKPTETWDELNKRHEREKKELVQQMSKWGYSQSEAARELGMTASQLNNYLIRNDIKWIVHLR